MVDVQNSPSLGLYIHWPFCISKCPYCDFNSYVGGQIDLELYQNAYHMELERIANVTPSHTLSTIFFGGGTPSLMPPSLTEAIIEKAKNLWKSDSFTEVTLEANPSTVERQRFLDFKKAGINRLSLGIQSFDDEQLAFLGRNHSAEEGIKAIESAQNIFERVSFDLIYARPNQTCSNWENELRFATQFKTTHLSLYQLTIESGTAFAPKYHRGEIVLPDDTLAADLWEVTQSVMDAAGLPLYEVSNHAKPGEESRHNLVYWRYQDYVGVGPGAHGRYTSAGIKVATEQYRGPDIWIKQVLSQKSGNIRTHVVSEREQLIEELMMGLRLKEGIAMKSAFNTVLNGKNLEYLVQNADMEADSKKIRVTPQGFLRLNGILRYLLKD